MAKKNQIKMINCRYPKCSKLHPTTELRKDEAYWDGKHYYHPDCYHTMQTVNKIAATFKKEINPLITGKQYGMVVSIINHLIFVKNVDVDFLLYAVEYFVNKKPGKLQYPQGLHYIVQDRDVIKSWKDELNRRAKMEIKEQLQSGDGEIAEMETEGTFKFTPQKAAGFDDILK